jgi:D-alanyl-D-alanine carboxypeptidase/D-alanyl-D-alanine-endopeptidase (penicillin-binding protein 4)
MWKSPAWHWNNEVTTGAPDSGDGVVIHGGETTSAIHLRGTVPLGAAKFQVNGAVPDPAGFAAHQFQPALCRRPAFKSAQARPARLRRRIELLKHTSPPLIEIITSIHATSDNHETECVFRMLGVKAAKPPDEVIREHWKARGLDFIGLRMEDGCGLARADFIRPLDLARLQLLAGKGPQGAAYKGLVALQETVCAGKAARCPASAPPPAMSQSKSGAEFCYAFMVNHYADGKAVSELSKRVMDAMLGL